MALSPIASPDLRPRPRRRRLLPKLLLGTCTMACMTVAAETVVRAGDGYRLFASRLQPLSGSEDGATGLPIELASTFLDQPLLVRPDLEPVEVGIGERPALVEVSGYRRRTA